MEEKCVICKVRPALEKSTLCAECSEHYGGLLKSATVKTRKLIEQSTARSLVRRSESELRIGQTSEAVLEAPRIATAAPQIQIPEAAMRTRRPIWAAIGTILLGIGVLSLVFAIALTSTVLSFIGLGLVFWGVLIFFIRPQNYIRSDLMNATALSSLKTIDGIMLGLGYRERGVYIPGGKERVVVFAPLEPFSMIPDGTAVEGKTFLDQPKGLVITPPGMSLSNLIEERLGYNLKNCGLEILVKTLPKVLVEDLEAVRDVEIEVKDETVKVKLVDSLYADFCQEVRQASRRCALGCPMCSALACILALATGKPVLFEDEKSSRDKRTTESSYKLLSEKRL